METIKGYLQEIPDMQYTQTGITLTKFPIHEELISPDDFKNTKVIAWAELAEAAANYLDIQTHVYIKGYFKEREWKDMNDVRHTSREFTARQIWRVDGENQFKDILEEFNENKAEV